METFTMKDALNGLLEERARLYTEMTGMLAEQRGLGEGEAFAKASADIDALDARIAQVRSLVERSAAADEARSLVEKSVNPAHRAVADKDDATVLRSLLVSGGGADFEARTMLTTSTDGAVLRPSFVSALITVATDESPILSLAKVIVTGGGENVIVPVIATGQTSTNLVGEGQVIPLSDVQTSSTTLRAYKFATRTEYSAELAQDSLLDVQNLVARDHGVSIARETAGYFLTGTGTNQPEGLFTGAADAGLANFGLNYNGIVALSASVSSAYASRASWVVNPADLVTLRQLVDADGRPLWSTALSTAGADVLAGRPVVADVAAPAGRVGFGSVEDALTVRQVGSVRVDTSIHAAFDRDLIQVRSIVRMDSKVTNPAAFKTAAIAP